MSKISVSSGIEAGNLNVRQSDVTRLLESEPYKGEAVSILRFLENHLCSATFDHVCSLAQIRAERRARLRELRHI